MQLSMGQAAALATIGINFFEELHLLNGKCNAEVGAMLPMQFSSTMHEPAPAYKADRQTNHWSPMSASDPSMHNVARRNLLPICSWLTMSTSGIPNFPVPDIS